MTEQRILSEKAPPSKKAEDFIDQTKDDFKERYGDDWKERLYATAWDKYKKGEL